MAQVIGSDGWWGVSGAETLVHAPRLLRLNHAGPGTCVAWGREPITGP